jgi:colanic acid/amylovoran biosynthesis glycosyltransferase
MRLAYVVSRFPCFSETFVVREVVEMMRMGHSVKVYALKNRTDPGYVPVAEEAVRSTQFSAFFLSWSLLAANLKTALMHPILYWGTLLFVLFHSLPTPKECLKAAVSFPKMVYYGSLMRERGVEHVHAQFANIPTTAALVIHRVWGIPYSFTAHAHDLFTHRSMLAQKLAESSFAVTISEYNRKIISGYCAPEDMSKLVVQHCGADVERMSKVSRSPEPGLIISVGRLHSMKGYIYLVEACALLRKRGVPVRCAIAGEGPERPILEERIRQAGIGDIFQLAGLVTPTDLPKFLSRGTVFALPCVRSADGSMDGLPTVLIEAMAVRIPVISTDISGVPELVHDGATGLLVPPEDAAALADAIEKLLKDSDLAGRLAEAGYDLVCDKFDLRKNAARIAQLIQQQGRS